MKEYSFKVHARKNAILFDSFIIRVWWIIAFGLSTYLCGTLIHNVWIKWDQSPVIVSFAEKSTPVWAIPFPAVTICPETKTYMEKLNFTDTFNLLRDNLTSNVSDDS